MHAHSQTARSRANKHTHTNILTLVLLIWKESSVYLLFCQTWQCTHTHVHTHSTISDLSQCHASTDSIRGEPLFFPPYLLFYFPIPTYTHVHTLLFLGFSQITSVWMFPQSHWDTELDTNTYMYVHIVYESWKSIYLQRDKINYLIIFPTQISILQLSI